MFSLEQARAEMERRTATILPDPVPPHPLLDGKPEIGRGEYSIVVDKEDNERVYKLISSPADYFLHTADDRPQGPHFPIVYADHGIIGRAVSGYPFHLLEMEKLYPLTKGSAAAALATQLMEVYWSSCLQWRNLGMNMGRIALHHMASTPFVFHTGQPIQETLQALSRFVEEYQILPDLLKADNLMMRKDGTLVFSDPVFIA